jgi:hypothetical protein
VIGFLGTAGVGSNRRDIEAEQKTTDTIKSESRY